MPVRTKHLKSIAENLLDRFEEWSTDWKHNRAIIDKLLAGQSKYVRNVVAGIITKEMKKRLYSRPKIEEPTIFRIACTECGHEMIWNSKARGITIRCELCGAILYRGGLKHAEVVEAIK